MLISLKNVTHIYNKQNQEVKALDNINLNIYKNEFIGLIGPTGSGKSTLVQLFNGLIKPTGGEVYVDGKNITQEKTNLKDIRKKIGLVFQYPEHQLFEENIYKEIAFGPKNMGFDQDLIKKRVKEAVSLVGMNYNDIKDRSPFNLSGGQQRKIAIAGVLAMKPDLLILDEPFAGLDPEGRKQLAALLLRLYRDEKVTLILISHRMDEIARLTTRVIVLNEGKVILNNIPEKVFSQHKKLVEMDLDVPQITEILSKLRDKGLPVRTDLFDLKKAAEEIYEKLRGKINVN